MLQGAGALLLHQCVRALPGRRLVCRGNWQGQAVYAKLFCGGKAARDARRDSTGVRMLQRACIPTPPLLYDGSDIDDKWRVLVFAAITPSNSADEVLQGLANQAGGRAELARRLVAVVAAHHAGGLLQRDMYLKNFLVTDSEVFTLDGDGIRPLPAIFGRKLALANLALLLSHFDVDDDSFLPRLYAHYAQKRGWQEKAADLHRLQKLVAGKRRRRVSRYADVKVFRCCTDIAVTQSFHRYQAIVRRHDTPVLRAWLDDLEHPFADGRVRFLKRGNTATVATVWLDGREVVVKRYHLKNFWHAVRRALRPSRAAISWANAHRLRHYAIATAEPLALQECRWGILRRQAYCISAMVDAPDAQQFFADAGVARERKVEAAARIAHLLDKLRRLGLVHGDMKATNLKILADGSPVLLDLDALHAPRFGLRRGLSKDLRRLLRNWQDTPEITLLLQDALRQAYGDAKLLYRAGILSEVT